MASPPFTVISDKIKYSELSVHTDNKQRETICQAFHYNFSIAEGVGGMWSTLRPVKV